MPQYFLSESDLSVLKRLLEQSKLRWQNTLNRVGDQGIDHQEHQAPETYVALTPIEGIPAMSGATPGSADCLIYQLIDGTIQQSSAHNQTLYNLAASALPGRTYVMATRDKFGTWFAGVGGTATTGPGGGGGGGGICAAVPLITDACLTKDVDGNYHLTLQRQSFNTATCQLGVASCKTDEGSCCPSTGTSNDGPCCGLTDSDVLCAVVSAPGCWLNGLTLTLPYSFTGGDWEILIGGNLPLPIGFLVSSDPCNQSGRRYSLALRLLCVTDPTSPDFGKWLWTFFFGSWATLSDGYCVGAGGEALPSSCNPFQLDLIGTLASDAGVVGCNLQPSSDLLGCECVGTDITIHITKASSIAGCQYPGPGTGTGGGGGSGGGPLISRAGLGRVNSSGGNVLSLTLPNVVVAAGARLIVCYACDSPNVPSSITWAGNPLTMDAASTDSGSGDGHVSIWSMKVTAGGTGDIVAANPIATRCAIEAIEVLNLPVNAVNLAGSNLGRGTTPSVTVGAATADEYAQAAFLVTGAISPWTLFTFGGQNIPVNSSLHLLTEGYDILSVSVSSLTAQLGVSPSAWEGVMAVYK